MSSGKYSNQGFKALKLFTLDLYCCPNFYRNGTTSRLFNVVIKLLLRDLIKVNVIYKAYFT